MKIFLITLLSILISTVAFAQSIKNTFETFQEFKEIQPSTFVQFHLKKRTGFNVFMIGGIINHRLKKIVPKTKSEYLTKEVWGVLVNDTAYINSYPYSQIIGYNKIIESGYYSYFIGEPARIKEKQLSLGIINSKDSQKAVCCKTSYVILPNGEVKWLTPELLNQLIKDNKELLMELKNDKIAQEDAYKMFDYLNRFNKMKEQL
jgi:hypothetical protein